MPEDIEKYSKQYDVGWDSVRESRWTELKKMGVIHGVLSSLEPKVGPPYDFPDAIRLLGKGEVNRERSWNSLTAPQKRFQAQKMAIHAAMIDRLDREVGRILECLREEDAFENTIVLFLSDNGASAEIMIRGNGHLPVATPGSSSSYLCLGPGWSSAANTPFRRHKTWVHEGGISTPLIIHWPAGIQAGGEWRDAFGHVMDIAPTLVELAGGSWHDSQHQTHAPSSPGRSLAVTFDSNQTVHSEPIWWLHEGNRAIREGDWKLVAAKGDPWELYDLSTDRAETNDLAAQFPERVQDLSEKWSSYTRQFEESVSANPERQALRQSQH